VDHPQDLAPLEHSSLQGLLFHSKVDSAAELTGRNLRQGSGQFRIEAI
jgi:hypothetical protein